MSKYNEQLQSAINDVAVIRQTLEKSKVHLGKLSALFFWIGGVQLAAYLIKSFGLFYFVPNSNSLGIGLLEYLKYVTLAVTFFLYLKIRRNVKNTNNLVSLQLFNLWGIILFLIPLLKLVIVPVYFLAGEDNPVCLFVFTFSDTLTYAATIMGIFTTGIVINKKPLSVASVILLAVYPLLFFFGGIGNVTEISVTAIFGFFSNVNAYAYVVMMLAYMILGVYFKLQNGGETCGDQ